MRGTRTYEYVLTVSSREVGVILRALELIGPDSWGIHDMTTALRLLTRDDVLIDTLDGEAG